MRPVLNATPLIYRGKKRKLEMLKLLFKQSLTTKEVEDGTKEALQLPRFPHLGLTNLGAFLQPQIEEMEVN